MYVCFVRIYVRIYIFIPWHEPKPQKDLINFCWLISRGLIEAIKNKSKDIASSSDAYDDSVM